MNGNVDVDRMASFVFLLPISQSSLVDMLRT